MKGLFPEGVDKLSPPPPQTLERASNSLPVRSIEPNKRTSETTSSLAGHWIIIAVSSALVGAVFGSALTALLSSASNPIKDSSESVSKAEPNSDKSNSAQPSSIKNETVLSIAEFPAVDLASIRNAFVISNAKNEMDDQLIEDMQISSLINGEVSVSIQANNKTRDNWSPWLNCRTYNSYGVLLGDHSESHVFSIVPGERRYLTFSVKTRTEVERDTLKLSKIAIPKDFSVPVYLELFHKDGKRVMQKPRHQSQKESEAETVAAIESDVDPNPEIAPRKLQRDTDFRVLEDSLKGGQSNMTVLLNDLDANDFEIANMLNELAGSGEFVVIKVFFSKKGWEDAVKGEASPELSSDFLLRFSRSSVTGSNTVTWMQEKGNRAGRFGTTATLTELVRMNDHVSKSSAGEDEAIKNVTLVDYPTQIPEKFEVGTDYAILEKSQTWFRANEYNDSHLEISLSLLLKNKNADDLYLKAMLASILQDKGLVDVDKKALINSVANDKKRSVLEKKALIIAANNEQSLSDEDKKPLLASVAGDKSRVDVKVLRNSISEADKIVIRVFLTESSGSKSDELLELEKDLKNNKCTVNWKQRTGRREHYKRKSTLDLLDKPEIELPKLPKPSAPARPNPPTPDPEVAKRERMRLVNLENYKKLKKGDSLFWIETQLKRNKGTKIRSYSVGESHFVMYEWSNGNGGTLQVTMDDDGLFSKSEHGLE